MTVWLLLLMGYGCASTGRRDLGPFYYQAPDLHGQEGYRALGPLIEQRESGTGQQFRAVRPFWSRVEDEPQERAVTDIVWPVGMFKTRQGELDWRFLLGFGHDYAMEDPDSRHRWGVFPILFGGRSATGDPYFAVFPLGGTLHNFLGRDRVWFVLFPLYTHSEQGDNRTTSVLWPIYSHTRGGNIARWRVWPLYGYSHNPDRWTKRFVLWPIWTSVDYHYPDQAGGGFILFPLYGQVNVNGRHSRMLIPPLFKVEWSDAGHRAVNAPWPIFQYVDSTDEHRLYLFPLAGRRRIAHDQRWFALWPIASGRRVERRNQTLTQFRVLPFWQHERSRIPSGQTGDPDATETVSRYFRLWPLFMYRREDEHNLVRVPDLWPLKQTPAIERNWAPIWTLFRRERVKDQSETEFLWGVIRRQRDAHSRRLSVFPLIRSESTPKREQRSWQFLYGLLGYQREGLHREYQLLYFLRTARTVPDTDTDGGDPHREDEGEW